MNGISRRGFVLRCSLALGAGTVGVTSLAAMAREYLTSRALRGFIGVQATPEPSPAIITDDGGGVAREARPPYPVVDWDSLTKVNPWVVGWLTLEGTSVNTPVLDGAGGDWLHRDLWGSPSLAGTPFTGETGAEGTNTVVYGHHIAWSDAAFSTIAGAWGADAFPGIGQVWWQRPDGAVWEGRAMCAMRCGAYHGLPRRTSFGSDDEYRSWLEAMALSSDAIAPTWREMVAGAEGNLTLVTCSEVLEGQPWRTVVCITLRRLAGSAPVTPPSSDQS